MLKRLFSKSVLIMSLLIGFFAPGAALAGTNVFDDACKRGGGDSAVCQTGGNAQDPLTGPNGAITKVANVLAVVAGFAALIFLVMGGIKYITSGGDASSISSAKNTIIYALIGIAVIVVSRAILGFVLNRL